MSGDQQPVICNMCGKSHMETNMISHPVSKQGIVICPECIVPAIVALFDLCSDHQKSVVVNKITSPPSRREAINTPPNMRMN